MGAKKPTIFKCAGINFNLESVAGLTKEKFEAISKKHYNFPSGTSVEMVWETLRNEIHKAGIETNIPAPETKKRLKEKELNQTPEKTSGVFYYQ